jgi:hypothetical protein
MKPTPALSILAAAGLLAACAATPPAEQQTAAAPEASPQCLKTTGSNICRAPGTGNMSTVISISGDDLRSSGGPLTGARPGKIGD